MAEDGTVLVATWLELGNITRRAAEHLTDVSWGLAAMYPLVSTIPKTSATLSLWTRFAALERAVDEASRIAYSLCESLGASLEKFPLPDELPPDDRPVAP